MNIIYIHTHDSGRMLSPYCHDVPTPNLKEFAKDALLFTQAYCVSPTCSPSRSGLLTGRYPHQNGMLGLGNRGFQLNDYDQHLVRFLNKHNYKTVLCGIQHEAGAYREHSQGSKTIGYHHDITHSPEGYTDKELVMWDYQNSKIAANWITNYTYDKPLFLSFGFFATHREFPDKKPPNTIEDKTNNNYSFPPLPIPNNEQTREDYRGYLTSAEWFDQGFQNIINALKESNQYENSIIIVTTDHGIAMPFCKCNLYDGGIGVAFIMRTPHMNVANKVTDALISQIDLFPTLCDLLSLEKPSYLDGYSFAHLFNQEKLTTINTQEQQEIFAEMNFHTSYEPARCVRTKRYKYIKYYDDYLKINRSNIDNSLTKEFYLNHGLNDKTKDSDALYDLLYDPLEQHNLIHHSNYSAILYDLKSKLLSFQQKTNDPLLQGPIKKMAHWKVNKQECLTASSKNEHDYIS